MVSEFDTARIQKNEIAKINKIQFINVINIIYTFTSIQGW